MTTKAMTVEGAAAEAISADARPYAPSWVDILMGWIARAPGPTWLAYLVLLAISLTVAAFEGLLSATGTLDPIQLVYGFFFVTPLAMLHYLDHIAGESWDAFRPVTNLSDAAAARVRYELTVAPARSGLVILFLGYLLNTTWYIVDPAGIGIAGQPPLFVAIRAVVEGYVSAALFMLLYQTVRQLVIVNRLHDSATNIDLFRPRAVHAMSRLTARSATGIVLVAVFTGWPLPGISEQAWLFTLVAFSAPMLLLALVAFFVPLRGLHDRLVEERSRLQTSTALGLHQTIDSIHELVDAESRNAGDAEQSRAAQTRIDALSKAQTALVQERDLVSRLSTWPWDPTTLRAVVSAVALPIVLFLVTRLLERVVL
jgi:hypothetical protein